MTRRDTDDISESERHAWVHEAELDLFADAERSLAQNLLNVPRRS